MKIFAIGAWGPDFELFFVYGDSLDVNFVIYHTSCHSTTPPVKWHPITHTQDDAHQSNAVDELF